MATRFLSVWSGPSGVPRLGLIRPVRRAPPPSGPPRPACPASVWPAPPGVPTSVWPAPPGVPAYRSAPPATPATARLTGSLLSGDSRTKANRYSRAAPSAGQRRDRSCSSPAVSQGGHAAVDADGLGGDPLGVGVHRNAMRGTISSHSPSRPAPLRRVAAWNDCSVSAPKWPGATALTVMSRGPSSLASPCT
jgi:hypothetical protein